MGRGVGRGFGRRVQVGVVWEIPRLEQERALWSAEQAPEGGEAEPHLPAAQSPTLAGH